MTVGITGGTGLTLAAGPGRPVVVTAEGPAAAWTVRHRTALREAVLEHGAVLVRGLQLPDAAALAEAARGWVDEVVEEREAFARRRPLPGGARSSLAWPPDQPMCMHHELSYTRNPPQYLVIGCLQPPESGGVTGLADAEAVLAALPPGVVERFRRTGWQLVRSYGELIGVPWQEAFGTTDRGEAEAYARAGGIRLEWQADGGLRTVQRRPAVVRHPQTGRECWFNQIAFLNEWTMDPLVREYLLGQFGPDGLPYTTRYGDGEPVDEATVATINDCYEAATVREPWQAGDVLFVDNIRTAHSREPYRGPRETALVFGNPTTVQEESQ